MSTPNAPGVPHTHIEVSKFARSYIGSGGNGTEAMLATKPGLTRGSAARRASTLLKRDDVKQEIQKALDKNGISWEWLVHSRKRIVQKGLEQLDTTKVSPNDVNMHLTGIEKIYEKLEKREERNSTHLHLHLKDKGYTELMQERQKYHAFFGDILDGETLPQSMRTSKPGDPEV